MMKKRQKLRSNYRKHSDSEDDEETELFVKNKTYRREIPTVEKIVEDGETLQSIAIRYHCTIEDLKRLNNIHKENEIFAKRTIKVPYRPFSLAGVHNSGTSSPVEQSIGEQTTETINSDVLKLKLSDSLNVTEGNDVNAIIFNSNIVQKVDDNEVHLEYNDSTLDDEEINLIPQETRVADPILTRFNCSGSDGDISLKALLLCIVVVIFAIPVIYVFYIAEHPEQYHHQQNS